MINKRFNELGTFRKLKTEDKTSAVKALNELNKFVLKTGTILWYAGDEIPDGWALCDGSIVNIADYPELYDVIGDTYNLPTDTFDTDESFRLPSGTARVIAGYDETKDNFKQIGFRNGMNEVPVDIDFTQSQHKLLNVEVLQNDEEAGIPIKYYTQYDKNTELDIHAIPAWYPDSYNTDSTGYDCWRQYDKIDQYVKVITEDVDWYCFNRYTTSTSTAGLSETNATHYNIQPYITLKMIIKVDKEIN